jgi:hypothetical protein
VSLGYAKDRPSDTREQGKNIPKTARSLLQRGDEWGHIGFTRCRYFPGSPGSGAPFGEPLVRLGLFRVRHFLSITVRCDSDGVHQTVISPRAGSRRLYKPSRSTRAIPVLIRPDRL